MRVLAALLLLHGCTAEAAPAPPSTAPKPTATTTVTPTIVPSEPMVGPFKTALAACQAAPPCDFIDDSAGPAARTPTKPDCSVVKTKDDPFYEANQDSDAPRWLAKGRFAFAPVTCAVAEGVRAVAADYYLYAKRGDGWWRTAQPLVTLSYNEKVCSQQVNGVFKVKGERLTFRFQGRSDCLDCNKQSTSTETLDLLAVVDLPVAPASPTSYPALVTGQHRKIELEEDAPDDLDPTDLSCKPAKKSVVLKETWSDANTLTLTGAATWGELVPLSLGFGPKSAPSTAGTYTFKR